MKAKMPDEEEVPSKLLGDNLEQLIFEINEFCNSINSKPGAEIPQALENYLKYVAKTGNTVFPWSVVKNLYRTKMLSAIASFSEEPCPNESFVLERFDLFRAAPFTVQRLTELIIQPNKHYRMKEKFLRGLEKTVLVVTTVEPKSLNATGEEINESNDDSSMPWLTTVTSDSENQHGNSHVLGDSTNTANLSTSIMTVMPSHSTTTTDSVSTTELQPSSSSTLISNSLNIHRVVTTEGSAGEVSIEKSSSNGNSFGESLNLSESESSSLSLSGVMIVDGTRGEEDMTKSLASSSLSQSESGISDTVMPMTIDYNIDIGEGGDNNNIGSHTTNYSIDTTTNNNNNDGTITHVNLNQLDESNNSNTQSSSSSLIFTETECNNDSSSSTTSTTTSTPTPTLTPSTSDLTVTTVYPQISNSDDDDDDDVGGTLLTDEIVPETIPIITNITHQNPGELANIVSTTNPVNIQVPFSDSKIDLSEISIPTSEINLIATENTTTELVSSVITDTESSSESKQRENDVENDDDDDDDDEESFEFIENDDAIDIADDKGTITNIDSANNLESPQLQELANPSATTIPDINDSVLNIDPLNQVVSNTESVPTELSTLSTSKTEVIGPEVVLTEETSPLDSTLENDKSASNIEASTDNNTPVSLG